VPGTDTDADLTELEQGLLDHFASTNGQTEPDPSVDIGEAEEEPEEGEADATPDTEEDEEPTEASDEGGEGEGEDGREAPAAIQGITIGDREFNPAETQALLELANWASSLTPQQQAEVNNALSGNYVLTPREQTPAPAPAPAPVATSLDPSLLPLEEGEEEIDPRAAQRISELEARVQANETATQQTLQQQQVAEINVAMEAFTTERNISPADSARLQQSVIQSQILVPSIRQHNGDLSAGTRAAMESAYWNDPQLREAELTSRILARDEKDRESKSKTSAKKRKSSSLSGSGGSVSRTNPQPSTKPDRRQAMVEELSAHMGSGQAQ